MNFNDVMNGLGLMFQLYGAGKAASGSFYDAKAQQLRLNYQASMMDFQTASQKSNMEFQASSQQASLEFQAQIADINARMAERAAQSELLAGQRRIASLTLSAGQLKGKQRASMAANGIDLGVGSAAETLASTDLMKEIDKNTLEVNAVQSAWGYRTKGSAFSSQAIVQRGSASTLDAFKAASGAFIDASNTAPYFRSTASAISPYGSAFTSLLGSATPISNAFYNYGRVT